MDVEKLLKQIKSVQGDVDQLRQIRDEINKVLNEPMHVCVPVYCNRPHWDITYAVGDTTTYLSNDVTTVPAGVDALQAGGI